MSDPKYTGKLYVYCAWCKKFLYTTPCLPENDGKESHGICSACAKEFEETTNREDK